MRADINELRYRHFKQGYSVRRIRFCIGLLLILGASTGGACAQEDEPQAAQATNGPRLALVIGQADYRDARLVTATADASHIAEALESAGFSVDGGADLEQQLIRDKIRSLVEKATLASGTETIFVYLGGRVAQINGENTLLPVGAQLERASDVVLNGFRINDLVNALKLVPAKARMIVIDAAAPPEHLVVDKNFSPGLAIIQAPEDFLIAFNQNPGRPLLEPQPPMGLFLRGFLDALQKPVASYADVFALARQRVFEESQNREMPWEDNKLTRHDLAFFPPLPGAALSNIAQDGGDVKLASLSRDDAFKRVIASDSILDYQAFLVQFPKDEAVPTVQYNLAVRREAELWSRALQTNTPQAYWTYIDTYPDGGNVEVARQKLLALGARVSAPAGFAPVAFANLPPPLPDEMITSSASLPAAFLPRPPSLGLPPIAPVVTAATALPVAAAVGKQLPRVTASFARPSWTAAPVRPPPIGAGPNATVMRSPTAAGLVANAPVRTTTFQPISAPSNLAGAPADTARGGNTSTGPAGSFRPLNTPQLPRPAQTGAPVGSDVGPKFQPISVGPAQAPIRVPVPNTAGQADQFPKPIAPGGPIAPARAAGTPDGPIVPRVAPVQVVRPNLAQQPTAQMPQQRMHMPQIQRPKPAPVQRRPVCTMQRGQQVCR